MKHLLVSFYGYEIILKNGSAYFVLKKVKSGPVKKAVIIVANPITVQGFPPIIPKIKEKIKHKTSDIIRKYL